MTEADVEIILQRGLENCHNGTVVRARFGYTRLSR